MFNRKWLLLIPVSVLLAVALVLARTAWEHRGFFAYQYDVKTSVAHASYQEEVLALVRQDPPQAFARFREILKGDPLSYNVCHGIAHQLGHEAFETFGFAGAMSFQDAMCGGGYIHGVIEGRFGVLQEKEIIAELPTICAEGQLSCYHGVGHGLMIATRLNVPSSLAYCDALPGLGRRNCYDGVWMHLFDKEESGARKDAGQPFDVALIAASSERCASAASAYQTSCYFYLPRIFAHAEERPFDEVVRLCETVDGRLGLACAAGSGHSVMKYHIAAPLQALQACDAYQDQEKAGACQEGGSLYYLFADSPAPTDAATEAVDKCLDLPEGARRSICERVRGYRSSL